MKRYRHYNKGSAIILSCFGSVIEQDKYFRFEEYIKKSFKDIAVFTAFSSKMVIKELAKQGQIYKNLPQVMADVDMEGYKRYIVVSVNIFPTDEHEVLIRMVKGFKNFSLANIRYTNPLLHKTKETSLFLKGLDENIRKGHEDIINLYVIHGVPVLNLGGLESVSYSANFLKMINKNNLTCSLEGEFPFYAVKNAIKNEILERLKVNQKLKVQVVPMLLVSGNHYFKDMIEICEEIGEYCDSFITPPQDETEKFNILGLESSREIFKENIEVEIKKLGL
jgi:sirohydrochlorin cobaltochelatase